MTFSRRTAAPSGDLATYARETFSAHGMTHDVYQKGTGPAVLVIAEMPGISPMVLGFADRVVALGCTAVLPDLFGTAGRDPLAGSQTLNGLRALGTITRACVSREFVVLATGKSSPVVQWLRALGAQKHTQCGGPGIGVVGMCFTGGFALAMAADSRVLAPVLSQPSLPMPIGEARKCGIDCDSADLDVVVQRCASEGLKVIGLRFDGDPLVPPQRFDFLRKKLGDGFIAVELAQSDGRPGAPMPRHHSVLTVDLIDEPEEPTRAALDQVLNLFRSKLLQFTPGAQTPT